MPHVHVIRITLIICVLIMILLISMIFVFYRSAKPLSRSLYKTCANQVLNDLNTKENMVLIGRYGLFDGLYIYNATTNSYNHEIFNVSVIIDGSVIKLVNKNTRAILGTRIVVSDATPTPGVSVLWLIAADQYAVPKDVSMVLSYHGRQDGLYNKDVQRSTVNYNVYKHDVFDYWLVQSSIVVQIYTEPQLRNVYKSHIIVSPDTVITPDETIHWQPLSTIPAMVNEPRMQLLSSGSKYNWPGIFIFITETRRYAHMDMDVQIVQTGISLIIFYKSIYIGTEVINDLINPNKTVLWISETFYNQTSNVNTFKTRRMILFGFDDVRFDGIYILDDKNAYPTTTPPTDLTKRYIHSLYNDFYIIKNNQTIEFYKLPINNAATLIAVREISNLTEPLIAKKTVYWQPETVTETSSPIKYMQLSGFDACNGDYKYDATLGLYRHVAKSIYVIARGAVLHCYEDSLYLGSRAITTLNPQDGVSVTWTPNTTIIDNNIDFGTVALTITIKNFANSIAGSADCNGAYNYNRINNRYQHTYNGRVLIDSGESLTCLSMNEQINYGSFPSSEIVEIIEQNMANADVSIPEPPPPVLPEVTAPAPPALNSMILSGFNSGKCDGTYLYSYTDGNWRVYYKSDNSRQLKHVLMPNYTTVMCFNNTAEVYWHGTRTVLSNYNDVVQNGQTAVFVPATDAPQPELHMTLAGYEDSCDGDYVYYENERLLPINDWYITYRDVVVTISEWILYINRDKTRLLIMPKDKKYQLQMQCCAIVNMTIDYSKDFGFRKGVLSLDGKITDGVDARWMPTSSFPYANMTLTGVNYNSCDGAYVYNKKTAKFVKSDNTRIVYVSKDKRRLICFNSDETVAHAIRNILYNETDKIQPKISARWLYAV